MTKTLIAICIFIVCANIFASDYPVINEVYHSAPPGQKWIEIYNPSPFPFQLQNWSLQVAETHWDTALVFPTVVLAPRQYIVIGETNVSFADYHASLNLTHTDTVCGIRLVNEQNNYTDTILYGFSNPHQLSDDAHHPATQYVSPAPTSCSLARYPNGYDTDDVSDWKVADTPTPAAPNFVFYDLAIADLYITYVDNIYLLHTVIHDLSTPFVDISQIVLTLFLNDITIYQNVPNITFHTGFATFSHPLSLQNNSGYLIKALISYPHDVDNSNDSKILHYWVGEKPVILNEILYAPVSPEPEWIELFNPSDEICVLQDAYFTDVAGRTSVFSATLEPAQYFVLTQNKINLLAKYPFLEADKVFQPTSWATLVNTRDTVELFYSSGVRIDSLSYTGVNSMRGRSLERVNPWSETSVAWLYSTADTGGTPLAKNSVTPAAIELQIPDVSLRKRNDVLEIVVTVANNGYSDVFTAMLTVSMRYEVEDTFEVITEHEISSVGEYSTYSTFPLMKGYVYYLCELDYTSEALAHPDRSFTEKVSFIKSYLNERPPVV
ncbi:MAG: lamin tail domain-containing protein, partial [Candidatus Cloacimonetes bacterium]|nr:lamin tail domain-containing protein [Candidatus Cloacimonadota bacterium]